MRIVRTIRPVAVTALLAATLASSSWVSAASSATPSAKASSSAAKTTRSTPPRVRHTLPFISDDYGRALAEAKARQVPIFVESWAPW